MPSTRPMTPEKEYRRIQTALFDAFRRDHPCLDPKMASPCQPYYFPQTPTDQTDGYGFVEVFDGPPFDPDAYLARLRPEPRKRRAAPKSKMFEPLSLEQAVEALAFFNAGDPKDRFMTAIVFAKNYPQYAWETWHRAGSTKSDKRSTFWSAQKERGSKYEFINIPWLVKEAKSRGWGGPQANGGNQASPKLVEKQ
jgi:hypothetical protein